MKQTLIAVALLATLTSVGVQAQSAPASTDGSAASTDGSNASNNGGWTGAGEFGFASTQGNSRSQNVNAKLGLNQENEYWKNTFFLDGLRSKGQVSVVDSNGATINKFSTTANRYDGGASVGYKLDQRSYIVTAARYDHDDFGADRWQGIVSVGYGYIALKNERNELSFEIGPGYKEYQPAPTNITVNGISTPYHQNKQSEVVARGLVNYKYRITANTSLENTFLMEAGSKDKYYQDDIGLAVNMTKKMALKLGFQERYHSTVLPGIKHSDTLTTTNLVYNF